MDDFDKSIVGLRNVLGYLEAQGPDDEGFAAEAARTRLIIDALVAGQGSEAIRLIELPFARQYGGSGWQHVVSVGRELAQQLIESQR